ncbi:hypothetical protein EC957_006780 [Mortierella hygrophila]|uniref:Uncharacterized protein n=1 Tax=Mortierella hygrophila TaxID=979708 RepID=A0A9P6EXS5_9FUNG|nr:hypothetical protein EC957_006780 [Mortierella hygrophila]
MKLSLISSFLFLAAIVNAADNDYKQMCYETCVHTTCQGTNVNTPCATAFVGTYVHVDYRPRNDANDAVHASICVMAPLAARTFNRADYNCQLSQAFGDK